MLRLLAEKTKSRSEMLIQTFQKLPKTMIRKSEFFLRTSEKQKKMT